jgi:hypothetical protein
LKLLACSSLCLIMRITSRAGARENEKRMGR